MLTDVTQDNLIRSYDKFSSLINSETPQLIIPLQPLGQIGRDRRHLIITVIDLETGYELISEQAIA